MPYKGSYVWKLRQKIGHDLLIIPSADALAVDADGRLLLVYNKDWGKWVSPGGYVEAGQTSSECAARELLEEGGIEADPQDLVPFAFMSGHTATYQNGDVVQPFTQYFFTTKWKDLGDELDTTEIGERRWVALDEILQLDLLPSMREIVKAYEAYQTTRQYQMINKHS